MKFDGKKTHSHRMPLTINKSQSPQHGAILLFRSFPMACVPPTSRQADLGRSNTSPAHIHNFCEQLRPRTPKPRANQGLKSFACFFGNAPLRFTGE
jgi:hypothetical protein